MIKQCRYCKKWFEGTAKKRYCSSRCKKNYENSLRSGPVDKRKDIEYQSIPRPETLNPIAAEFWDKLAPTVIARGHLNVLSADSFAELCDIYSRLKDVNKKIDEARRLQLEDGGLSSGSESQPAINEAGLCEPKGGEIKESTLSDLKRKYSKQFLDYCKEFYLTPRVNRGEFGLRNDKNEFKQDSLFD